MLDILGFWVAVSVAVLAHVVWVVPAMLFIVVPLMLSGIPDKTEASAILRKVWHVRGEVFYIFGVCTHIYTAIVLFLSVFGGGLSLVLFIDGIRGDGVAVVITMIANWAERSSGFFGITVGIIVTVAALRMVTRYAYYTVKFKEKVEAHVSDNSIHR